VCYFNERSIGPPKMTIYSSDESTIWGHEMFCILHEYAYSESREQNIWYCGYLHNLNISLDPGSSIAAVRHGGGLPSISTTKASDRSLSWRIHYVDKLPYSEGYLISRLTFVERWIHKDMIGVGTVAPVPSSHEKKWLLVPDSLRHTSEHRSTYFRTKCDKKLP